MAGRPAVVTLYVPCDVVAYRLRIGFGGHASPMEGAVLAAVHALDPDALGGAGAAPVKIGRLTEALGMGHRITMDVVHDLWRKSHLRIGLDGTIGLSTAVRERLRTGGIEDLDSAETAERVVELMVERLSGRVLPVRGARSPAVPTLVIEPEPEDTTIDHVPGVELVGALHSALNADRMQDEAEESVAPVGEPRPFEPRRMNILSFRRAMVGADRPLEGRRWLPLDVEISLDQDTERLSVRVVDRALTPVQQDRAAQRLTAVLAEAADRSLANRLAAQAQPALRETRPLEDMTAEFAARLVPLDALPTAERGAAHRAMAARARQIAAAITEMERARVQIDFVAGADIDAAIDEIARSAKHQLVLVVPELGVPVWGALGPLIRDALERRVQVVLLWGSHPRTALDRRVRNLIVSLLRDHAHVPFVAPLASANVRTWMAVADDRALLSAGGRGRGALEATRLGMPDGTGSDTIRRILGWVGRQIPDGRNSRRLLLRSDDFSPTPRDREPSSDLVPELPERPPDSDSEAADRALASWREAWEGVGRELTRLRDRVDAPVPQLVEDLRHSDLLWHALRNARRRLVIASEHLDRTVVDEVFAEVLRGRLRDGVEVTVSVGGDGDGQARTGSARERLTALAEEFPATMRVVPSVGRFLVWDDDVVVSGFDMLREGIRGAARARLRRPAQLGLLLHHAETSDAVATLVGMPARREVNRTGQSPELGRPMFDRHLSRARQRILNCRAENGRLDAVVDTEMARVDDPWALLDSLDGACDDEVRAVVTARALLDYAEGAAQAHVEEHRRCLVQVLWRAGRYAEAALLRLADPDPERSPRPAIAVAAAAIGTPALGDILMDVLVDVTPNEDESIALLAVACRQLAGTHDARDAESVAHLGDTATGLWAALASAALTCHSYLPGTSAVDASRRLYGLSRRADEHARLWDDLDRVLALARQPPKHLDGSIKTVFTLFRSDEPLGQLVDAAARRDLDRVRAIVTTSFPEPRLPADLAATLLDDTWARVATRDADLLHGAPRTSYLARLAELVTVARGLLDTADDPEPPLADDVAGAVRELARRVAEAAAALDGTTMLDAEAERGLAREQLAVLLAELDPGAAEGAGRKDVR